MRFCLGLLALSLFATMPLNPAHAFACAADRLSLKDTQVGVEDDSNPRDGVVHISGYVENMCLNMVSITVTVEGADSSGAVVSTHTFGIQNIPAGGKAFDITGATPYDPKIVSYNFPKLTVDGAGR